MSQSVCVRVFRAVRKFYCVNENCYCSYSCLVRNGLLNLSLLCLANIHITKLKSRTNCVLNVSYIMTTQGISSLFLKLHKLNRIKGLKKTIRNKQHFKLSNLIPKFSQKWKYPNHVSLVTLLK